MPHAPFIRTSIPALLAAALVAAGGCSNDLRHPDTARPRHDTTSTVGDFHVPPFEPGRVLDTVLAVDFDGDSRPEYVVSSVDTASMFGRADLITIYSLDSLAHRYRQRINAPAAYVYEYRVADATGDGLPDLIAMRTGGGNDVVANSGMSIFSWRNGALAAVYETDYRNPTLGTIPGKGPVIFLHAWLWPDFAAHAEAREYLDDILAYRRGTFTSIRNEEARTFRALADSNLARYRELKPKFLHDTLVTVTDSLGTRDTLPGSGEYSGPHPLFSDAALAIILLGHADGRAPIRAFWAAEHEYLVRRMPAEQYNALDDLYRFWGGLEPRQ